MPRATMDQALVTGLSASANHALVTLVQDAIQSTALVLVGEARRRSVDEKRWSRATIAADVAAIGAGIAIQRALRARNREPLARAGARTGGYMLAVTGTAGAFVGALQEAFPGNGSRMRQTLAVVGPAGAGLAAFNTWQVRKRAQLDGHLPRGLPSFPREINRIRRGNGGCALGVRRGRASVRRPGVSTWSRAALPGNAALWRPVAHAAAFAGLAAGARVLAVKALARIEHVQESAEAGVRLPAAEPPREREPRESRSVRHAFPCGASVRVDGGSGGQDQRGDGRAGATNPVRAYVGLESAPSEQERVDLAMRELERTGAFDRSWLMVASPTGTGYVNYAAASILEFLTRGDCASVAMQYSARPSPLSLDRVKEGRLHTRMLCKAIAERCAQCPAERAAEGLAVRREPGRVDEPGRFRRSRNAGPRSTPAIDYAIWIGTPHFSKWKERVLYDDRPDVDRSLGRALQRHLGVGRPRGERARTDPLRHDHALRRRCRGVRSRAGDPGAGVALRSRGAPPNGAEGHAVDAHDVVLPGPHRHEERGQRRSRAPSRPGATTTGLISCRSSTRVLGLKASPEQLDAIHRRLEARELFRSRWAKNHKSSDKGLAAEVLSRLIREERAAGRDTDERLLELVRAVAMEEFDAGGAAIA